VLLRLAKCVALVPYARRCTAALNLTEHPSLLSALQNAQHRDQFCRHTMHSKVVYRADGFSLYTAIPPLIEFRREHPGPRARRCGADGGGDGGGAGVHGAAENAPPPIADHVAGAPGAPHIASAVAPSSSPSSSGPPMASDNIPAGSPGGGEGGLCHTADVSLVLSRPDCSLAFHTDDPQFSIVMQQYFREHFRQCFGSKNTRLCSRHFSITLPPSGSMDAIFGSKIPFQALTDILAPRDAAILGGRALPFVDRADGCRELFFKTARWFPEKNVRAKLDDERGFDYDSIAISVRPVIRQLDCGDVLLASEGVDIGSSITSQPLILGLSVFPLELLLTMKVYASSDDSEYGLRSGCAVAGSVVVGNVLLPNLLRDLIENYSVGGVLLDVLSDGALGLLVDELVFSDLIHPPSSDDAKYCLTQLGKSYVTNAVRLSDPVGVSAPRPELPVCDCNAWELASKLALDGWEHRWHPRKALAPEPYDPLSDSPRKLWYLRMGSDTLRPTYLMALLSAKRVEHFGKSMDYKALMGWEPAARTAARYVQLFPSGLDEDDMCAIDDYMAQPGKRSRSKGEVKAAKKMKLPIPIRDDEDVCLAPEPEESSSSELEHGSEDVDVHMEDVPPGGTETPPAPPRSPRDKPPSPSSLSSSSTSSSSGSSSGASGQREEDVSGEHGEDAGEEEMDEHGPDIEVDPGDDMVAPPPPPSSLVARLLRRAEGRTERKFAWEGWTLAAYHPGGGEQTGWEGNLQVQAH
jgi:hypothetical protein